MKYEKHENLRHTYICVCVSMYVSSDVCIFANEQLNLFAINV